MRAAYILLGLGAVFLIAAAVRLSRDAWKLHPKSKTWLIIGVIFGAVGSWLVARG